MDLISQLGKFEGIGVHTEPNFGDPVCLTIKNLPGDLPLFPPFVIP